MVDAGVEFADVDFFGGVLGFDVAGNAEVDAVGENIGVGDQFGEMGFFLAGHVSPVDALDVGFTEFVLVALVDEIFSGVDEEDVVGCLALLDDDDAHGDADAEKEIIGHLDDSINEIVGDQVLTYLLLGAATIEHARELHDGSRAADAERGEDVHGEGEIGLAGGCENTGRGVAVIVDERDIVFACPVQGVGRIGADGIERLEVAVERIGERVATADVEVLEVDAMEEHVDAAKVVGGEVDFLTEEVVRLIAQDLAELQQQRATAASGVVDLVELLAAVDCQQGHETTDLLRGEELATALAGCAGVHGHEELISVAKGVVGGLRETLAEVHVGHGIDDFAQAGVALRHGCAELVAIDVEVAEEALEVPLAGRADCGALDVGEDGGEGFVEVSIVVATGVHVLEELAGEDEIAFFLDCAVAARLGKGIGECGVVEIGVAGEVLLLVEVMGEVFADEAVKEHAEDIALEVPAVD